jgi:tetratricopeptide (TPR) repeat protein
MAQGRYIEAKQLFERALVYTPNYAALQINLAIVNDSLGNPAIAEQYFARALQLEPDYPAAHTFYARWMVQRGRAAEAVPHLQKAVSLSPANIEARYQLLEAYVKTGQREALKALALDTLSLVPDDPRVKQYLSNPAEAALAAPQRSAEGESIITTPDGWLNASLRAYQAGDYLGSIDAAQKAILLKPDFAEAYNNIAAAFASLGRWDEAIQAAKEALRLKPDFALARNNLAWAEREKRKLDK